MLPAIQPGDSSIGQYGPGIENGETDMVRKIALVALLAGGLALSACNTVRGIGQDVESVGKEVKKAPD